MSDAPTPADLLADLKGKATATLGQLDDQLALAASSVEAKERELADAVAHAAAVRLQHATVSAMIDAGKVVSAIERAMPAVEKEIADVVSSPWAKRVGTWGPWLAVSAAAVYGAGHFLAGWPL